MLVFTAMIGTEVGQVGGVVDGGQGSVGGEIVDGPQVDRLDVARVAAVGAEARAVGDDVAHVAPYAGAPRFVAAQRG